MWRRPSRGKVAEGPEKDTFIDAEKRRAGNQYFNEETLREMLRLKQDQTYRERKAELDVERLIKFYRERGFINAKVVHRPIVGVLEEIRVPVDEARVPVEFEITEGERFRIGRRDITGNQRTQVKSILRVLDEYDFRPPESYNADIAPEEGGGELETELQRRVFAKTVSIRPLGQGYDYNPDVTLDFYIQGLLWGVVGFDIINCWLGLLWRF